MWVIVKLKQHLVTRVIKGYEKDTAESTNPREYREIIWRLIFRITGTRPDLCYAVTKLSQNLSKPTKTLLGIAMHALKYIKGE